MLLLLLSLVSVTRAAPQHIVFVVADDLGWSDVSWNNRSVISPHLSSLGSQGVFLNRSYVAPTCTPSRAAFLTGLHAHRTGLQSGPLGDLNPTGLPTRFWTLPERLRKAGYRTHLVGKWHLGFCADYYLPTRRGFDSFYGYLTGAKTYYTQRSRTYTKPIVEGLDFRDNETAVFNLTGVYAVDAYAERVSQIIKIHNRNEPLFLFYSLQSVHTPLEVPDRYLHLYPHEKDENRRKYLGMVSAMDEAVGRLVYELQTASLLDDTLLVFTSDNGGVPGHGGASNAPLRGQKDTLWEGGVRVPGLVVSPRLAKPGTVENSLIHATDWMPTFLELAGVDVGPLKLDGTSLVPLLMKGEKRPQREMVVFLDPDQRKGAFMSGKHKLLWGDPVYHRPYPIELMATPNPLRLFDVETDPGENHDIADQMPQLRDRLWSLLQTHIKEAMPSMIEFNDPRGNPALWGGVWSPGWCWPFRA